MGILCRKHLVFISILLLSCFVFLMGPGTAAAHGPKEVKLSYDVSTQTLQAAITHSPFSSSHYIEKVEVKKNGRSVAVQAYKSQAAETFTWSVKVPAAPGDILEVKATCSRFGSKTEKLKVGEAPGK